MASITISRGTPFSAASWVLGGIGPFAVLADEGYQALVGFSFGHGFFDDFFAHVQVDLARRAADVAKVGIGHFAGAVHHAAHDGDLHAFQVARARGDAL